MEFRELNFVTALAKDQTLAKAARELGVSQSVLNRSIQNLEKELEQPLFRRLGDTFLPTYAGERYVEKAQLMLAVRKELDQELSDIVRKDIGELRIAFPIMRGTYMLPCTLPVFRRQFPKVRISVREADSNSLESMVLSGDIDLAFFTLPIRDSNVSYELINREEVVLLMSADHPLAGQGASKPDCKYPWLDITKLEREPFILQMPDQRTRQISDKLFQDAGIEPNVTLVVRNILASAQLAAEGYGMTFIGETHLRHIHFKASPACFSVGSPNTTTSFVAAFRRETYLPHYAQQFIKIVKEFT